MIGPNTVATAGHNIFSHKYGNWANRVIVTPARNGSGTGSTAAPYGTATSTGLSTSTEWAHNQDVTRDWGIIRLNKNLADDTGYLALGWNSNSYNGTSIRINGYPKVNNSHNFMYRTPGTITSSQTLTLRSNNVRTEEGMSGSPVVNSNSVVIAVMSGTLGNEINGYSQFVRLDRPLFLQFSDFRTLRA
jgi:glutamyl endopeptidase